jgi:glycosyltransferase involved in cell wall biosynthesis
MTTPFSTLAGHTRRPRIGVDLHALDDSGSDERAHVLFLYREVVRRAPEYDFVFLCTEPARLRAADPAFTLANVHGVAMPLRSEFARLAWQLALLRRRHRIDLLHVQDRMPLLPWGPCAVTVHDTAFEMPSRRFATAFAALRSAQRAALLLAVDESSRKEIARLTGVEPLSIRITGNGVDRGRFRPATGEEDGADLVRALGAVPGHYLLAVGHADARNDALDLLRAFALLPAPRPSLVIVGERDAAHETALAEVQRLGLAGEVVFLDRAGDDHWPALVRHAGVLVHVPRAAAVGRAVLEAMASGVPAVVSHAPALVELAAGAALTVDPGDPQAIAGAIARLLADASLRARLVARGADVAARRGWDTSAKALLAGFRRFFAGLSNA